MNISLSTSLESDKKILTIATDELVAKEVAYHPCCYRKYTLGFTNSRRENKNKTSMIQDTFDTIKHVLWWLYEDPNIIEFSDLTNKAVKSLHNLNQEDVSKIRQHLDRKIENEMDGINCVTVKNKNEMDRINGQSVCISWNFIYICNSEEAVWKGN